MSVAEQHEWLRTQVSRRNMLKGGLVGAGALLAGSTIGSPLAGASARPRGHLSPTVLLKGDQLPGVTLPPFGRHIAYGADPTTQMNVTWQVGAQVSSPYLRFGEHPGALDQKVDAELVSLTTPWVDVTSPVDSVPLVVPSQVEQFYLHANLSNLTPGQKYFYAVGHTGWSPTSGQVNSFTVAPQNPSEFRFTAFGDQGVTYDAVATSRVVGGQQPAFHLHAGDWSYAENGGSGLLTDPYDPRVFDAWFTEIEGVAANIPWMATVGNHEMEPWYPQNGYGGQLERFQFIGNAPSSCPVSFSFSYGNVGFIALDANDVSYELEANLGYTGGAQTTWLGSTLAGFRGNPAIDFIVVYFHQCAYSTCTTHASDGGIDQYWTPLFDQYQVDLVINGHNHIYERTDPIIGGSPTGPAPIGSTIDTVFQGTTYVTAGGAGKSLYSFPVPDSYAGNIDNDTAISTYQWELGSTPETPVQSPITVAWSEVRYTGYALLVVDSITTAGGVPTLSAQVVMEDGVTVIDEFSIVRGS
jgi:hypothetical protein